jgi:hypothetical protein
MKMFFFLVLLASLGIAHTGSERFVRWPIPSDMTEKEYNDMIAAMPTQLQGLLKSPTLSAAEEVKLQNLQSRLEKSSEYSDLTEEELDLIMKQQGLLTREEADTLSNFYSTYSERAELNRMPAHIRALEEKDKAGLELTEEEREARWQWVSKDLDQRFEAAQKDKEQRFARTIYPDLQAQVSNLVANVKKDLNNIHTAQQVKQAVAHLLPLIQFDQQRSYTSYGYKLKPLVKKQLDSYKAAVQAYEPAQFFLNYSNKVVSEIIQHDSPAITLPGGSALTQAARSFYQQAQALLQKELSSLVKPAPALDTTNIKDYSGIPQ